MPAAVPEPCLPRYDGPCTSNLIPSILGDPESIPSWMPQALGDCDQVVVLVIDGLGWEQYRDHQVLMPAMSSAMSGSPITTVAPTTTATALTSITTGTCPGEHGVIGYRIAVERSILNVLRWTTHRGDARMSIPPDSICSTVPFEGHRPPVVVRAEFEHSGFTQAHLSRTRHVGYRMPSTMAIEVIRLLGAGEPFIYAYYDGVDKVAHEYGIGEHYHAELIAVDLLVKFLLDALPPRAALVITADHGHIEVGDRAVRPHPEVMAMVDFQSGESRFRWLHGLAGTGPELLDAARTHHQHHAWVLSREEMIKQGWFGPMVTPAAARALGDVALVPFETIYFEDPADTGPFELVGRHGSMTAAEVMVPLLFAQGE